MTSELKSNGYLTGRELVVAAAAVASTKATSASSLAFFFNASARFLSRRSFSLSVNSTVVGGKYDDNNGIGRTEVVHEVEMRENEVMISNSD